MTSRLVAWGTTPECSGFYLRFQGSTDRDVESSYGKREILNLESSSDQTRASGLDESWEDQEGWTGRTRAKCLYSKTK